MANWHGYILLTKPSEISSGDWTTILAYLDNSGVLNETATADQPSERWHTVASSDSYLIESTFDTTELTLTGLATHMSTALGGTPNVATMEGYLDDGAGDLHWQAFEKGQDVAASRASAKAHLDIFGYTCRGPRVSAGDEYYVATNGDAGNDGSIGSPWTLAHVLSGDAGVQQKDTIWLRGGNYGTMPSIQISGYHNDDDETYQPIYLRGYGPDWIAGSLPIIEGAKDIHAIDIEMRNLFFTGYETERFEETWPPSPRYDGITIRGRNIKLINCIVENMNAGIGNWEDGPDAEIYGTMIHNGGSDTDDSRSGPIYDENGLRTGGRYGHGHGQYIQNLSGTKLSKHSILLSCFGRTFSAHSAGGGGQLNNIEFRDCYIFGFGAELGWLGSYGVVQDAIMDGCIVQRPSGMVVGQAGTGGNANITNNLFIDETDNVAVVMRGLDFGEFTGNTVVGGNKAAVAFTLPVAQASFEFDNNIYYTPLGSDDDLFSTGGDGTGNPPYTATEWLATGRDPNSTFNLETAPSGQASYVWPNTYKDANDIRVGIFVVVNWDEASSLNIDLSTLGMVNTQDYKFYNAFNYLGDTPIDHTSDGDDSSVSITLTGWTAAPPAGTHRGNTMLEPLDPIPTWTRVFIVEEA